jgi:hypothetical protein
LDWIVIEVVVVIEVEGIDVGCMVVVEGIIVLDELEDGFISLLNVKSSVQALNPLSSVNPT